MIDFDIILGMDFLHKCYAIINYQTRVLRFQLPNEIWYKRARRGTIKDRQTISNIKANKMFYKGRYTPPKSGFA